MAGLKYLLTLTLLLAFLSNVGYVGSSYVYEVVDEPGLDYIADDILGLDHLIDRVDVTRVVVEITPEYVDWRIDYKGVPLSLEEADEAGANGTFIYRIIITAGLTVNGGDGNITFSFLVSLEYDEVKQEYVLASIIWWVTDEKGIWVEEGFGVHQIVNNSMLFRSEFKNVSIGPPSENNQFLNLTSFVDHQGRDLMGDTLSYNVDVEFTPIDTSPNVDEDTPDTDEGGDTVQDDQPSDGATSEPSTGGDTEEKPSQEEVSQGDGGFPFYIVAAIALVVVVAIGFLFFKGRKG